MQIEIHDQIPTKAPRSSIARRSLAVLTATVIVAGFVFALIGSARLGTRAALAILPESARRSLDIDYPLDQRVVVGADGEPVFLSRTILPLRNFFFTHPEAEARRAAETEGLGLRRFVGEIPVRTVRQDADLMNVEVLSGALTGGSYWIHTSQLPDPEVGVAPDDREDDASKGAED